MKNEEMTNEDNEEMTKQSEKARKRENDEARKRTFSIFGGQRPRPFVIPSQCDAQRAKHASEESRGAVAQLSSDVVDSSRARR